MHVIGFYDFVDLSVMKIKKACDPVHTYLIIGNFHNTNYLCLEKSKIVL